MRNWKGWDTAMRSTDEHLQEIMKRSQSIKEKKSLKKMMIVEGISACACLILIIVSVSCLPHITNGDNKASQVHYGSLILQTSYMGYVVVGVLAFILGVVVTLLSMHWKKMKQKELDKERDKK